MSSSAGRRAQLRGSAGRSSSRQPRPRRRGGARLGRRQRRDRRDALAPVGRRTFAGDSRGFVLRRRLAVSDLIALTLAAVLAVAFRGGIGRPEIPTEDVVAFRDLLAALAADRQHARPLPHPRPPPRSLGGRRDRPDRLRSGAVELVLAAARGGDARPGASDCCCVSAVLWVAGFAAILGLRSLTRALARRRPWYEQRVAILGTPVDVRRVSRAGSSATPSSACKVACVGEISDGPGCGPATAPEIT